MISSMNRITIAAASFTGAMAVMIKAESPSAETTQDVWTEVAGPDGKAFFYNEKTKEACYMEDGWRQITDPEGNTIYMDNATGKSQRRFPAAVLPEEPTDMNNVAPEEYFDAHEEFNIVQEALDSLDIPYHVTSEMKFLMAQTEKTHEEVVEAFANAINTATLSKKDEESWGSALKTLTLESIKVLGQWELVVGQDESFNTVESYWSSVYNKSSKTQPGLVEFTEFKRDQRSEIQRIAYKIVTQANDDDFEFDSKMIRQYLESELDRKLTDEEEAFVAQKVQKKLDQRAGVAAMQINLTETGHNMNGNKLLTPPEFTTCREQKLRVRRTVFKMICSGYDYLSIRAHYQKEMGRKLTEGEKKYISAVIQKRLEDQMLVAQVKNNLVETGHCEQGNKIDDDACRSSMSSSANSESIRVFGNDDSSSSVASSTVGEMGKKRSSTKKRVLNKMKSAFQRNFVARG